MLLLNHIEGSGHSVITAQDFIFSNHSLKQSFQNTATQIFFIVILLDHLPWKEKLSCKVFVFVQFSFPKVSAQSKEKVLTGQKLPCDSINTPSPENLQITTAAIEPRLILRDEDFFLKTATCQTFTTRVSTRRNV